jgi:hypothetical protein
MQGFPTVRKAPLCLLGLATTCSAGPWHAPQCAEGLRHAVPLLRLWAWLGLLSIAWLWRATLSHAMQVSTMKRFAMPAMLLSAWRFLAANRFATLCLLSEAGVGRRCIAMPCPLAMRCGALLSLVELSLPSIAELVMIRRATSRHAGQGDACLAGRRSECARFGDAMQCSARWAKHSAATQRY